MLYRRISGTEIYSNCKVVYLKNTTANLARRFLIMLRSAFRGKQPADPSSKDDKSGASGHGKSHFFFHREHDEDLREGHVTNSNENLNNVSTDGGVSYNVTDGELYIDCNQEFLDLPQNSGLEKENKNEEGEKKSDKSTKDQRKGSFSNSERQIYEMQLAQLQEQLVNTMIDFQDMSKWIIVLCI